MSHLLALCVQQDQVCLTLPFVGRCGGDLLVADIGPGGVDSRQFVSRERSLLPASLVDVAHAVVRRAVVEVANRRADFVGTEVDRREVEEWVDIEDDKHQRQRCSRDHLRPLTPQGVEGIPVADQEDKE